MINSTDDYFLIDETLVFTNSITIKYTEMNRGGVESYGNN